MKSQIFKTGGGAGIGSYIIVLKNGELQNPNAEKIRVAYDAGDTLLLSIIDDSTTEALLPLSGYVDTNNVLHLVGRDFDDNKTYDFAIDNTDQSVDMDEISGITMGDGTIPTEGGGGLDPESLFVIHMALIPGDWSIEGPDGTFESMQEIHDFLLPYDKKAASCFLDLQEQWSYIICNITVDENSVFLGTPFGEISISEDEEQNIAFDYSYFTSPFNLNISTFPLSLIYSQEVENCRISYDGVVPFYEDLYKSLLPYNNKVVNCSFYDHDNDKDASFSCALSFELDAIYLYTPFGQVSVTGDGINAVLDYSNFHSPFASSGSSGNDDEELLEEFNCLPAYFTGSQKQDEYTVMLSTHGFSKILGDKEYGEIIGNYDSVSFTDQDDNDITDINPVIMRGNQWMLNTEADFEGITSIRISFSYPM